MSVDNSLPTDLEANAYGGYIPPGWLDQPGMNDRIWEFFNGFERWPNFHYAELKSKGNGALRLHYETLDALQRLRNTLNRPIPITSYYRDPVYNLEVGGAEGSYHLAGRAVDTPVYSTELGRWSLWHHATKAGFKGLGLYPTFTHLDTGPHRVWDER